MTVEIPSFAKINLGLRIGPRRDDGFHDLRTVYQTIALHDIVRVSVVRGSGIEIRCNDPRVPTDSTNTCWRIADRAMAALKARGRVVIEIKKRLPVQGGLGGASGNAVAALLGLERVGGKKLSEAERLRIAAEVGSDLPLFLAGGTVLGVGRGEEIYPLPDLPAMPCVIALPDIAVSTPKAFADWDALTPSAFHSSRLRGHKEPALPAQKTSSHARRTPPALASRTKKSQKNDKLIKPELSDRMSEFSREISAWLGAASEPSGRTAGVSSRAGGRAESLLLDLVRTGIENDFERVVFPQYPELREVKRVLERAGASYASLSGSGSAIYGLFDSRERGAAAVRKLGRVGIQAVLTSTLTRPQYWKKLLAFSS